MSQTRSAAISHFFKLAERGTTVRTEVLAGCTTFLTMAYIVLVNPAILGQAGMPVASVAAATCFAAAFGSILMGWWPIRRWRWRPAWASTPISALPSCSKWVCPGRWRWAA